VPHLSEQDAEGGDLRRSAKPFILTNRVTRTIICRPAPLHDSSPRREQSPHLSPGEISEKIRFWRVGSFDVRRRRYRGGASPLTFTFSDVHANKTATETDTFAVNNAGAIAGDYVDAKGIQHGMILAGKKLTTIDHKNCSNTGGFAAGAIAFYGINKARAAAGWCTSTKTGFYEGFVYASGKFSGVNFPKSNGTQAIGINDKGDVVACTWTPAASSMAS
jgi:hypothetical protein